MALDEIPVPGKARRMGVGKKMVCSGLSVAGARTLATGAKQRPSSHLSSQAGERRRTTTDVHDLPRNARTKTTSGPLRTRNAQIVRARFERRFSKIRQGRG